MRVLLDECIPRRLGRVLAEFDVRTVPEEGWAGKKNGELLGLASVSFDVFVTIDQNLQYQQNLRDAAIAIVVLKSATNRYDDLLPLVPRLIEVLQGDVSGGGSLPRGQVNTSHGTRVFAVAGQIREGAMTILRDAPRSLKQPIKETYAGDATEAPVDGRRWFKLSGQHSRCRTTRSKLASTTTSARQRVGVDIVAPGHVRRGLGAHTRDAQSERRARRKLQERRRVTGSER